MVIENQSSFGGAKEVEVPWEWAQENFSGVTKGVVIWVWVDYTAAFLGQNSEALFIAECEFHPDL